MWNLRPNRNETCVLFFIKATTKQLVNLNESALAIPQWGGRRYLMGAVFTPSQDDFPSFGGQGSPY